MNEELKQLQIMRTRWRRWLGNKTAANKPYWTTLLDSKWSTWCRNVCYVHDIEYYMVWSIGSVKNLYRKCINVATFEELLKLDGIYASERI